MSSLWIVILEIIINTAMMVEVGVRMIAMKEVRFRRFDGILNCLLTTATSASLAILVLITQHSRRVHDSNLLFHVNITFCVGLRDKKRRGYP